MQADSERQRRNQIITTLSRKQDEAFESSLPMSRELFYKLFDFLDSNLQSCDDKLTFTEIFLAEQNIENTEEIIGWLEEHGGYCDCEVLANVEEQFE